jgi:SAM-dependent methyltransferase
LDVGCGNGRFGLFLVEHGITSFDYHGLDNSAALLDHALQSLSTYPQILARGNILDVVSQALPDGTYDLIVLFGLLHHVPGFARRSALLRACAERVAPGGLLVFACWRFYEFPRLRERIMPWGEGLDLEPNDHLLDWRRGQRALRYCHYVDDAEHAILIEASGLTEIETYRADGESGTANRYSILAPAH